MNLLEHFKTMPLFWRGGLLGVALAALVFSFFGAIRSSAGKSTSVIFAKGQILSHSAIDRNKLQPKPFPTRYLPKGAISIKDLPAILGQKAAIAIPAGAILRWQDLRDPQIQKATLSDNIPPGKRIVSLNFVAMKGLRPTLAPGDRIDLLGTFQSPAQNKIITKTLFQNLLIARVQPQVLTFLSPKEVELLFFASEYGDLKASLRNRKDLEINNEPQDINFLQFLGLPASTKPSRSQRPAKSLGPQILSLDSRKR